MATSPTVAAAASLNDVFAAVAAPLLSFLPPRDVFAVSLINKYAYAVVNENLFNTLYLQQKSTLLPPRQPKDMLVDTTSGRNRNPRVSTVEFIKHNSKNSLIVVTFIGRNTQ